MGNLKASVLVPIALVLMVFLYWFRPGGIEGPRVDAVAVGGKAFSHSVFTEVLSKFVREDGTVDYGGLRQDSSLLDRYLGQLRAVSPASAPHRFRTNSDRLAYYINAYNAFVIAGIRDLCPVENIDEAYAVGGFFWRTSFLMGQELTTLTAIEAERIRGVMVRRPAVHLALVKGARGYLPLGRKAYEGATLDADLEVLKKDAVTRAHIVKRAGPVLKLSKVFEWYQTDFGSVEGWLKPLAPKLVEGNPRIEYMPFDGRLNGNCQ